jgi:hypothetical protein
MPVLLRNNVSATLAAALSATDTGIALSSGQGSLFPSLSAGEYFYATLSGPTTGPEIIKVTNRVGDTLTVTRAQEGTAGQHFPAGGRIEIRVTAASVEDAITDDINTLDATLRAYTDAEVAAADTALRAYTDAQVAALNFTADSFTGTGSQVNFTLSTTPISKNHTLVFIDGVYQGKAGYSVSGTTLTFSEAPPLNSAVECNTMEL